MIGWLMRRKLNAFEQDFDYDISYARDIYDASLRAFWKFSRILGLSEYREGAPPDAWFAAKLAATLSKDCGPCTQLVVTMAERQGVTLATLRAILAGNMATPASAYTSRELTHRSLVRRTRELPERLRQRSETASWGKT